MNSQYSKHSIHSIPFTHHLHLHCRICNYKEALWVSQKSCPISASGRQVLPQTLQPQKATGVSLWFLSSVQAAHIHRGQNHTCCTNLGQRWDTDRLPGLQPEIREGNSVTTQCSNLYKPREVEKGLCVSNLKKAMRRKKSQSHT